MKQSAKFHAKIPQSKFKSDSGEKRKEASETVVECAAKLVNPLYAQLEKLRLHNTV